MPAGNMCGCGWYRLFEAIPHSRSSALYLPGAVLFERLNSECEIMVLVEVYSTFSFYSGMGATFCLHKDISCIFQMFARLTNGRCTLWVHRVRECVCVHARLRLPLKLPQIEAIPILSGHTLLCLDSCFYPLQMQTEIVWKYMCVEFSLDKSEQQLQGVTFILYLCSFFCSKIMVS